MCRFILISILFQLPGTVLHVVLRSTNVRNRTHMFTRRERNVIVNTAFDAEKLRRESLQRSSV